jgi:hypothetical protein
MSDKTDTTDSKRQADAIEITPAMLQAGYLAWSAACRVDEPLEADILLVEKIFRAMMSERQTASQ